MSPWVPPGNWHRVASIDAHVAGEPLRVILEGFPELAGDTILARRRDARENHDHWRRALMLEPRGHADMYGCLMVPATTADGDFGVLFLHNEGFSTMCGHAIIGVVTVALECGILDLDADCIRIDTPAGRVVARADLAGNRVAGVAFENVSSFLLEGDLVRHVEGVGAVTLDLGYGGAFYAYVDARRLELKLEPANVSSLIDVGMRIKRAVQATYEIRHPEGEPDLNFLYGTIFYNDDVNGRRRNVCVFADGEVDRSPTGTGVSGRAAVMHAKGQLALHDPIVIDSLIGTSFQVQLLHQTTVGDQAAVVPEVTGSAFITGRHEFFLNPDDPLRDGFLLR